MAILNYHRTQGIGPHRHALARMAIHAPRSHRGCIGLFPERLQEWQESIGDLAAHTLPCAAGPAATLAALGVLLARMPAIGEAPIKAPASRPETTVRGLAQFVKTLCLRPSRSGNEVMGRASDDRVTSCTAH